MSEKTKEKNTKTTNKKTSVKAGKVLQGVVVSDKMQDTIVVAVSRYVKHPKYKKYVKHVKKYHVHDKGNTFSTGDKVSIRETKPV